MFLLVTVVMPAEYGIDPTGIGKVLDLKNMGEIRVSLAQEAAADREADARANLAKAENSQIVVAKKGTNYGANITNEPSATLATNESAKVKADREADARASRAKAENSQTIQATEATSKKTSSTNEIVITLAPNEGAEVKMDMTKDAVANYSWTSKGGKANFDVHGDSKVLKIKYHRYSRGVNVDGKSGTITAAFDGAHGWFWRNRTDGNITITLNVEGQYSKYKRQRKSEPFVHEILSHLCARKSEPLCKFQA